MSSWSLQQRQAAPQAAPQAARNPMPQPRNTPSTPRATPAGRHSAMEELHSHQRQQQPIADERSHSPATSAASNTDDLLGIQEAHEKIGQLTGEVEELLDENSKLREIEQQFWLLLMEREQLQNEVDTMRSSLRSESGAPEGAAGSRGAPRRGAQPLAVGDGLTPRGADVLQQEHDRMATALSECLSLLVDKEVQKENELIRKQGPVAAFLSWLEIGHERGLAMQSIREAQVGLIGSVDATEAGASAGTPVGGRRAAAASQSPAGRSSPLDQSALSGPLSQVERMSLTAQLRDAQDAVKRLQEELDRTDVSRAQALEDAERLQAQLEGVVDNMQELRNAYAVLKAQAERASELAREVPALKLVISEREAEVAQLKATVIELQRLSDVGGAQLAADAARIRRELQSRSSMRAQSPPTPKAVAVANDSK